MRYVFDMDGVLIDTRKAVEAAYARAGVTMPAEAWGLRWQEWCSREAHDRKNAMYPTMLNLYARELPAFKILQQFGGSVLTSASTHAARLVQEYLRFPFHLVGAGCTTDDKIGVLKTIRGGVVYVDDDLRKGLAIMQGARCRFIHARPDKIGHFDLYNFRQEIEASWTSSYWPQDVTSG